MVAVPDPHFGSPWGRRIQSVLVAHEERHIVRLCEVNLERAGYTVATCFAGEDAYDQITAQPPDLAILGVMLPGLNGFEILQRLRQRPETRDMPVLLLTGKATTGTTFAEWSDGANGYLSVPFNPKALLDLVRRKG